ncbi:hypothetical protein OPV22_034351 [Ensete ventricosum]|uniref:PPC domain-containing protein n=1 Tax=Ensete ventricosum TaxID=4639 RepID=A0AAV8P330_ENSVE|nr:hypothetical protein OPV22_034351 [Ensete ventricosum]
MKDKLFQHHYLQQQQQQKSLSDEVDSGRSSGETKKTKLDEQKERTGGDGSTIEVVKRPRGRPPGSKNKPKLPVVITREAEPSAAMRPHVLEIPMGHDVADSLAGFSRRRNLGICVLSGTGAVANVTLRQPHYGGAPLSAGAPATIVFRGRFEILSISATFLPRDGGAVPSRGRRALDIAGGAAGAGRGGHGGRSTAGRGDGGRGGGGVLEPHLPPAPGGGRRVGLRLGLRRRRWRHGGARAAHRRHQGPPPTAALSSGMSLYGSHLPSDVIWAPTARPPPPPPY